MLVALVILCPHKNPASMTPPGLPRDQVRGRIDLRRPHADTSSLKRAKVAKGGWRLMFEQASLEFGDLAVLRAVVVPGGGKSVRQSVVICSQSAELLLEGGVLSGQPPDGIGGQVQLKVPDPAHKLADVPTMGLDLRHRLPQRVLGIQRTLAPGRLHGIDGLLSLRPWRPSAWATASATSWRAVAFW